MNMVLSNVSETIYNVQLDPIDHSQSVTVIILPSPTPPQLIQRQTTKRDCDMLFVRGDAVVLVAPPPR